MRRRQAFAALTAAQTRAAELMLAKVMPDLPKPEEFTGGPLIIGTPVKPAVDIVDPHRCPKCGRTVGRGKAMHQKHCKGSLA